MMIIHFFLRVCVLLDIEKNSLYSCEGVHINGELSSGHEFYSKNFKPGLNLTGWNIDGTMKEVNKDYEPREVQSET